jgi:hypothetical protein
MNVEVEEVGGDSKNAKIRVKVTEE